MVAIALPLMSTQIQREKEEELVFRGFQYAEAIRLFRQRFQHYPTKLEQLLEVKPRCIRQLWKDPMTKDGKWGLIPPGGGVPITPPPGGGQQGTGQDNPDPTNPEGPPLDAGSGTPKPGDQVTVGPISGVYSRSTKKAFLVFYGHTRYDEWRFTDDLLGSMGGNRGSSAPGIGNPGQVVIPNFSVRWLGRPMPFLNQTQPQPQDGNLPNGRGGGINQPGVGGPGSKPRPAQRPQ